MAKMAQTIVLFDVDGTLTKARCRIEPTVISVLENLRKKVTIGVVGGSDLPKQKEQLGPNFLQMFDYNFAENGVVAFKKGELMNETSIAEHLGEDKLKRLINYCLKYIAELDIPIKRGTFIEFRTGMINVSPIGRNCSRKERDEFEEYCLKNNIRKTFVEKLKSEFPDFGLTYSIGGQISFDVFPEGWDKTYCLQFLKGYDDIHFFGDKTFEGGNDFEIFSHPKTKGHTVTDPEDTIKQLKEIFGDDI